MSDVLVRAIDLHDDEEIDRFLAFQVAHGTPRHNKAEMREAARSLHAQLLLVAEEDDVLVGCGNGNIHTDGPDEPVMGNLFALPGRSDVLRAIVDRIGAWTEAANAPWFYVHLSRPTQQLRDDLEAAGLTHGGDRYRSRRELTAADRALELPDAPGVSFTSLGDRPDLAGSFTALWNQAMADIPGPMDHADITVDQVRTHLELDDDEPFPERVRMALDDESGELVAFVALVPMPGSEGRTYGHRLTAVRRDRRGQGLAVTAKLEAIRWAARHGVGELVTTNDSDNAPIRAVNAKLGFEPMFTMAIFKLQLH